jgi:glycosyltransferase involved in cell wall biosynthesis
MPKAKIAILGTRGIPARYGGFETLVENIAPSLALKGYQVSVYARKRFVPSSIKWYRGVRIVHPPALPPKYLDTVSHTFFCLPHLFFHRPRVAIVCNAINALFCIPLRIGGVKVVFNVDGQEWERRKWNLLGRLAYRFSSWLATRLSTVLIADAEVIRTFYKEKYGKEAVFIPYGHELPAAEGLGTLEQLGLQVGDYYLFVGRLEPENNPEAIIRGFTGLPGERKLVVVGDNPYNRHFVERLRTLAGPRVLMPGAIYGNGYHELLNNAFAVVQASEVGGTHPALVEAMGAGRAILLHRNPQNEEVAGEEAVYFDAADPASLTRAYLWGEAHPDAVRAMGLRARERARERYSWDKVKAAYRNLVENLTA